jgi:hypothetical protein
MVWLPACSSNSAPDAGLASDSGGAPLDAASAARDTGPPPPDAASDSGQATPDSGQATPDSGAVDSGLGVDGAVACGQGCPEPDHVATQAALCSGTSVDDAGVQHPIHPSVCFWSTYLAICGTECGSAIVASVQCLTSSVGCRNSFADMTDPSVMSCLDSVNAAYTRTSTSFVAAREAYCSHCSDANCTGAGMDWTTIPLIHFSDKTLARLIPCFQSATSCDTASACFQMVYPNLGPCH